MDDPTTSGVTEGFGLMFYNARWYDPAIGRFAQADTIVPGGLQGLDRYAYVNNAPTRFTDPSGHKCAGDDAVLCSPASLLHISSNPNSPDNVILDPDRDKGAYSLYEMYLDMWNNKEGWWWDRYGSGGFTIWEFMAIVWGYEQAGYPNTDNFATALSNKAGFWCHVRNCDPSTAEGSLIFLSKYSQSARNRVSAYINGKTIDELFYKPPAYWSDDTMKIVIGIQQNAYTGSLAPMALFDVGNVSLRSEIFRKMINLNMIRIVWGNSKDDRLVILTYCQSLMVSYVIFNGGAKAINQHVYNNFCGD
jgi:RHS repeat-associated protein